MLKVQFFLLSLAILIPEHPKFWHIYSARTKAAVVFRTFHNRFLIYVDSGSCCHKWMREYLLSFFNTDKVAQHSLVILLIWGFQSTCWFFFLTSFWSYQIYKPTTNLLHILKKRYRNENENSKYNISYVPVVDCSLLSNT